MRNDIDKFAELGATVVVVAPHDREEVGEYWQHNGLPYVGIPDPDGIISERFAQQWKLLKLGLMPAQFVIDCAGTIVFAHYAGGMGDIPTTETIVGVLGGLSGCAEAAPDR